MTQSPTQCEPMEFEEDKRLIAPCVAACPAEVDVPRYMGYIAEGRFSEAHATVREAIPLPVVCGLICYRPCEPWCRRGIMEAPVAINAVKRAAAEHGSGGPSPTTAPPTGKRVAVVGSGPAGLTAVYYLASRRGHHVTLFEAMPKLGGMLAVGLPEYKVPRDLLEREVGLICATRVDVRTGTRVESIDELIGEYDAVLLAVGQTKPRPLDLPSTALSGGEVDQEVEYAAAFLRDVNLARRTSAPPSLVVIGGDNVAMDAARSALRIGSEHVTVLMPSDRATAEAHDHEIADAEAEGVEALPLMRVVAVRRAAAGVEVAAEALEVVATDELGRETLGAVEGSRRTIAADAVLVSLGLEVEAPASWELDLGPRGRVLTDLDSCMTNREGVFAAGDAVTGPGSIVDAMDQGKRAAVAIDRFLGGDGDISEVFAPAPGSEMRMRADIAAQGKPVTPMPMAEAPQRNVTFELVERGYAKDEAVAEARRCIRCDLWRTGAPGVWSKQQD